MDAERELVLLKHLAVCTRCDWSLPVPTEILGVRDLPLFALQRAFDFHNCADHVVEEPAVPPHGDREV